MTNYHEKLEDLRRKFESGVITENQIREKIGLPPVGETGDNHYIRKSLHNPSKSIKLSSADVTYTLLKDNEKKKAHEILLILEGLGLSQAHLILKFCMEASQKTAVVSTTY